MQDMFPLNNSLYKIHLV